MRIDLPNSVVVARWLANALVDQSLTAEESEELAQLLEEDAAESRRVGAEFAEEGDPSPDAHELEARLFEAAAALVRSPDNHRPDRSVEDGGPAARVEGEPGRAPL